MQSDLDAVCVKSVSYFDRRPAEYTRWHIGLGNSPFPYHTFEVLYGTGVSYTELQPSRGRARVIIHFYCTESVGCCLNFLLLQAAW